VKKALKRTSLYRIISRYRERKALRRWTALDQELFEMYSEFISPGQLCFDVGANMGSRVRILLKLGARVVAVEPQDECVETLKKAFRRNRHLTVVQKALGACEGHAEIMKTSVTTLSSLSSEWIDSVRRSGRFSQYDWNRRQVVPMTTLDSLIVQYGTPFFIKIDVEGFEYEVLKGLSRPVKMLCIEFTPEFMESTFNCIGHLRRLGNIRLNYSAGDTMNLALKEWVSPEEMTEILSGFTGDNKLSGDVYVQFSS
jgi:FkbM family methyltransferase